MLHIVQKRKRQSITILLTSSFNSRQREKKKKENLLKRHYKAKIYLVLSQFLRNFRSTDMGG